MVATLSSTRPVLPQFFEHKPLQCICLRIVALLRPIFDYFIRIIVFQLGMMKSFGARLIMRTYQRLTSDPREKRPFDLRRLAESKSLLISCGGTEISLPTADGKAEVSGLTFTSKGFFQHFFNLGAEIKLVPYDNQLRKVLVPSPRLLQPEYSPMKNRLYHDLHKFKFPLIPVSLPSGAVQAGLLPEEPHFVDGPAFIIHCHSPGRMWPMERSLFRLLCGAGYDGAFWDPRGTEEIKGDLKAGSKGNIKEDGEGGTYLDLRAVYQHVLTLGYPPHRIYASGFCEGGAMAAELYAACRELGVNFVGANLFDSMHGLVLNHGPIGRIFGPPSIPALFSKDPAITSRVKQDGFNTAEKFRNLPPLQPHVPPTAGKIILISSSMDRTVPKDSVDKICQAVDGRAPVTRIVRQCIRKDNRNDHTFPPYEDPAVWRQLVAVMN